MLQYYAILMKSNLCHCQLSSETDFIEAQIGAHNNTTNRSRLNYTINGAMYTHFKAIQGFSWFKISIHKLYDNIPNVSIPYLKVIHNTQVDVAEMEIPVKLNQLAKHELHDATIELFMKIGETEKCVH